MIRKLLKVLLILVVVSHEIKLCTSYLITESESLPRVSVNSSDENLSNEIEDTRIKVSQPYKYLLQTTLRLGLSYTRLANYLDVETALTLINDAFYMLSKPSTLVRVIKLICVLLSTFITSSLFFPATHKFADRLWEDPLNVMNLDGFLSNGLAEKEVLDMISSRTDEALNKVGLNDNKCRERSLCYMGEIFRCAFPRSSNTLASFANENFSSLMYKDNRYFKAFSYGFSEQNCTKVFTDLPEHKNCIGRFLSNVASTNKPSNEGSSS